MCNGKFGIKNFIELTDRKEMEYDFISILNLYLVHIQVLELGIAC